MTNYLCLGIITNLCSNIDLLARFDTHNILIAKLKAGDTLTTPAF
jgi:hypothetical protein